MSKEIKHKKAIYQSKKTTMKSIMPSLLVEDQDGSLLKSIEITLLNNSKKKKLEERLRPLPPLPRKAKVKKVRKEKKVRAVVMPKKEKLKRRKRRRKKP